MQVHIIQPLFAFSVKSGLTVACTLRLESSHCCVSTFSNLLGGMKVIKEDEQQAAVVVVVTEDEEQEAEEAQKVVMLQILLELRT